MPKEITHIHISELVARGCTQAAAAILERHPRIYDWGAVSPDLFYYDISIPWLEKKGPVAWGEIIHGRDGEDTTAHLHLLIERARQLRPTDGRRSDALFALVAGYLTHFAADTIFHPYVYSLSGNYYAADLSERRTAESLHRLFETGLDLHILRERGETLRQFGLTARIRMSPDERQTVLDALADALREAHRPSLDASRTRRLAHRAYRRSLGIISSFQWQLPMRLLIGLSRLTGAHLKSIARAGYGPHPELAQVDYRDPGEAPHPITGEPLRGKTEELIRRSAERGTGYVNAAFAWYSASGAGERERRAFRKAVPPLSLNNGMEAMPTRAMRYSQIHAAFRG